MSDAASIELPPWAKVSERRRAHIARVTTLLMTWAAAMSVPPDETAAWRDAGLWHDALRDAPEEELRALTPGLDYPVDMLHGPAAAVRLAREGEARFDVLDAIRWHTLGCGAWARPGRALYLADFLDPGRRFMREDRAALAARVPSEFDVVLRQVVRIRLEWSLREGNQLFAETVALWNAVR
jgi:2-amino-4-hydroxy-6-hydroxymethyldihydropteridine diphosphokinase